MLSSDFHQDMSHLAPKVIPDGRHNTCHASLSNGLSLPVIMTSGSALSAVDTDDCDDCVWSGSKGGGIGWGGNRWGDINGPAGW